MTLETGHQLQQGRYVIRALLGRGGMGTIYLAADRNLLGRLVAIKENADTASATQNQFQYEAILLARLTHSNLPRVTDHFIEPSGRQYLVMDYVEGDDLRAVLRAHKGPLPEDVVLGWLEQVLSALTYMHNWIDPTTRKQTPIIHRDIKPGNIKRTPNGRIVLVDFGVAKVDETTEGTVAGARATTPGYSPLEQYGGGTDVRSDIYALGATLYILLTGERPPDAPAIAAGTPLPSPRQRNRQLSRAMERVILRAMALHAADRYQSIEELRAALPPRRNVEAEAAKSGAAATPLEPHLTLTHPSRAARHAPRRAYWSGIGALVLLTLLVITLIASPNRWLVSWRATVVPAAPTAPANGAAPTITGIMTRASARSAARAALTVTAPVTATFTPTPTAAVQVSAGAAITPTQSAVATRTATPVAAVTPSPVATTTPAPIPPTPIPPTLTATPLPSATPTATPSPTPPHTPTATATATTPPTPTATASPVTEPTVTATALPVAGEQRTHPPDGAIYRFVPAGPFTMGSTVDKSEMPVHTVELDAFWIMETEVTNALYAQCVTAGACTRPHNDFWETAALADHPVTDVDWMQAAAYAAWVEGRLPTEAEWEKAARGTDERLFPWVGESTDATRLNFLNTTTTPVGSFLAGASPFGLLDMAGNVEEWVADWFSPNYETASSSANPPTNPLVNPTGPPTGLMRVVRGGSFNSNRGNVRTTTRSRAQPDAHFPTIGFRVVVPAR